MASLIIQNLSKLGMNLQPPTPQPSSEYIGLEYKWKNLVFRPAQFQREAIFAGMLGVLMVAYFLGKKWNEGKAREWWSAFDPKFSSQFRAMSPLPTQPLVSNTPSTYLHYLTGRRNLLSLHCVLNLLPRHNLVQLVQDLVWGVVDPANETGDELVLDFTLGEGGKGQQGEGVGVWGVVGKSGVLGKIRKERWDVTFTKTVDHPSIPRTHMLLTESADSTEYLLNAPNTGLKECLGNELTGGLLKSLIITDQPTTRPTRGPLPESSRSRHLTITLRLPPSGQMSSTLPWVQVGLNLCDLLGRIPVKAETTRKLRKTRQEVDLELKRSYEEEMKEENGDPEEEKKALKRKEELKRRAAMSDAERKKLELKEQKKQQRKAQIKQLKGGK